MSQGHNGLEDTNGSRPSGSSNEDCSPNPPAIGGRAQLDAAETLRHNQFNCNIATMNVRTLLGESRLLEMEEALEQINCDILGMCEVRRKHEGMMETKNGNLFCWAGESSSRGTGFWVKKETKNQVEEFYSTSDRISTLIVKFNKFVTLKLIQVYAPTSSSSDEDVETFYNDILDTIEDGKPGKIIILGDFNSKIGFRKQGESHIGAHGFGQRNERGDMMIEFCSGFDLKIMNSFFKKKPQKKWTWESPNGEVRNEIDFVLCQDTSIFEDVEVLNRFNLDSDHRILRATVKLRGKRERAKTMKRTKSNQGKVIMANAEVFQMELKNRFEALYNEDYNEELSPEKEFARLKVCMTESVQETERKAPKADKLKKIRPETRELIKKREDLRERRRESTKTEVEFAETRKLVKKKIRQDIDEFNEKLVEDVVENNKSLRKAKQVISQGKNWISSMKKSDGTEVTRRTEIMETCTEFYRNLYASPKNKTDFIDEEDILLQNFPPFLVSEVEKAISGMKNNRAPGSDGLLAEFFKAGGTILSKKLTDLFNNIMTTGNIPVEWKEAMVIILHKKGPKNEMKNYRPITLLSHCYKIFTKCLQRRITRDLDGMQMPEQAGFRSGYCTIDHIHSLNQLIEKCQEYKLPIYLLFIDFEKAFDTVFHDKMLEALQESSVDPIYLRAIREMYKNSSSQLRLEAVGPAFPIERGVRQGDPLSPKIFIDSLASAFRCLDWEEKGICIDGKYLSHLQFADDIVLISQDHQELQDMTHDLIQETKKFGLKINVTKTKAMTNDIEETLFIGNDEVDYVEDFIYLGQLVSFSERQDKELRRRIQNAWKGFWKLKTYLTSRSLPMKLKARIFNMCIVPILTYGCQTWSFTKRQRSRMETTQRRMERRMLNKTWKDKIRNEDLKKRSQVVDVAEQTIKLKFKWAGHLMRRRDDRWTKRITEWRPRDGKRSRGRQKTRWRDALPTNYQRLAQDRGLWRSFWEEAISRQRVQRLQ